MDYHSSKNITALIVDITKNYTNKKRTHETEMGYENHVWIKAVNAHGHFLEAHKTC